MSYCLLLGARRELSFRARWVPLADMYTFLGWLALGADCERGSGLKPGPGVAGTNAGLPAAPPAIGGSPPVAGPFCAIASVVPATSSAATIVRHFGVVIIIPPKLESHPQVRTPLSSRSFQHEFGAALALFWPPAIFGAASIRFRRASPTKCSGSTGN